MLDRGTMTFREPQAELDLFRPYQPDSAEQTTAEFPPEITGDLIFYNQAQKIFIEAGVGNLQYLTDHPEQIPEPLLEGVKHHERLRDKGRAELPATFLIQTRDIHRACKVADQLGMQAVVIGSLTSATQNFGPPGVKYDSRKILAIDPMGTVDSSQIEPANSEYALSNQATLDLSTNTLRAGAGLTPDHLNELLPPDRWLPLDLTTKNFAKNGAVMATGSMGPLRIRPSSLVRRVKLTDGKDLKTIDDPEEIAALEGLMGVPGAIVETEYKTLEVPKNDFGVLVGLNVDTLDPDISTWDRELANLIAHLYDPANVRIEGDKLVSDWKNGIITGMEIITTNELEFLLTGNVSTETRRLARHFLDQLNATNSKYAVYVTGKANQTFDQLLDQEIPDKKDPLQILMQMLKQGEIATIEAIPDLKEMHTLRETIPLQAKDEAAPEQPDPEILRHSSTTDHVTTISASARRKIDHLYGAAKVSYIRRIIHDQILPYVDRRRSYREIQNRHRNSRLQFKGYDYGHADPRGIDIHDRETVIANLQHTTSEEAAAITAEFAEIKSEMKSGPDATLNRGIEALRSNPNIEVGYAEKGQLPHFDRLPPEQQGKTANIIANSPPIFRWRMKGTKVEKYLQEHGQGTC